jgi:hypothetical protein
MRKEVVMGAPSLVLEQEAEALLREGGAFRVGSGIACPRREQRLRARERAIDLFESECLELGRIDLWEEIDWIAAQCGLTPREKAAFSMARLEKYTHREIARHLGISDGRVTQLVAAALRKIRARFEDAVSPRLLFWEEVRRKARCIYRKRRGRAAR